MAIYTPTGNPVDSTRGIAQTVRDEFQLVATGLNTLPAPDVLAGGAANYAADTGAANAYAVTLSTQITAYYNGLTVLMKAANANSGASTLAVTGATLLAVKSIKRGDGSALQTGDILAGQIVELTYDGTNFQLNASSAAAAATAAAASAASAAAQVPLAAAQVALAAAQVTLATTQAGNAGTSATNAGISEANAAASFDSFDDRYLGAKAADPTLDNDGNALINGALYFNSVAAQMRVYNLPTTAWVAGYLPAAGYMAVLPVTVTSGATACTAGNHYYLGGAHALTFPASPASGDEIEVTVPPAQTGATILPNGKTFNTNSGTMNLDIVPWRYRFKFNTVKGWI